MFLCGLEFSMLFVFGSMAGHGWHTANGFPNLRRSHAATPPFTLPQAPPRLKHCPYMRSLGVAIQGGTGTLSPPPTSEAGSLQASRGTLPNSRKF